MVTHREQMLAIAAKPLLVATPTVATPYAFIAPPHLPSIDSGLDTMHRIIQVKEYETHSAAGDPRCLWH